jgi:hypothetical protein
VAQLIQGKNSALHSVRKSPNCFLLARINNLIRKCANDEPDVLYKISLDKLDKNIRPIFSWFLVGRKTKSTCNKLVLTSFEQYLFLVVNC